MVEMPIAVWSGSFRLFGVVVHCHRLSDGTNIIEDDSMMRLWEAMASDTLDLGDIDAFSKFQAGSVPKSTGVKP